MFSSSVAVRWRGDGGVLVCARQLPLAALGGARRPAAAAFQVRICNSVESYPTLIRNMQHAANTVAVRAAGRARAGTSAEAGSHLSLAL